MAYAMDFVPLGTDAEESLPYADGGVIAGFPSPAQDYVDRALDLNRDLIANPDATYYAHVKGDAMTPGMYPGDIIVVDRSMKPFDGCIAVCLVNGEFYTRKLDLSQREREIIQLVPTNPGFESIPVRKGTEFEVWGIVRYVIRNVVTNVCSSRLR